MTGLTAFTEVTMSLREINCNFVEKQGSNTVIESGFDSFIWLLNYKVVLICSFSGELARYGTRDGIVPRINGYGPVTVSI